MPAEKLRIRNFAGITEADIELGRINVLIGPQASGKSVCAKLFFFFKETTRRLVLGVVEERNKPGLRAGDRDLFLSYFPPTSWGKGDFLIEYSFDGFTVTVRRKQSDSSTVDITYSEYYDRLLHLARQALRKSQEPPSEDDEFTPDSRYVVAQAVNRKIHHDIGPALANTNYFIPAGRSFFSTIQGNVFSFIASNLRIDPFLAEFGRLYERFRGTYMMRIQRTGRDKRNLVERVSRLIRGTYIRVKGDDFIRMGDERQIPLASSSSGQQEVLPLAITLASLAPTRGSARVSLIVEEPEAHLYPSAQREIVHLFAASTDFSLEQSTTQFLITTHSPYILAALNNLMYGAKIVREHPEMRGSVTKILGDDVLINPKLVCAYALGEGRVRSILDRDTELVQATLLDRVSGEIAREFESLMAIDPAD